MKDFRERCRKIKKRYRGDNAIKDEEGQGSTSAPPGLQILWSTIQTQIPAVYQFAPDVEVSRRFRTKDPTARVAALILERYLDVEKDRDDFAAETLSALQDRLLCSLGQMWVEYEPITAMMDVQGVQTEQIVDCRAPAIHIDIEDFLHSPARKWREVRWVARRQFFTRDEIAKNFERGQKQFKWDVNTVPLDSKARQDADDEEKSGNLFKRAEVWQIWDEAKVYYICKRMSVPLQIDERPLILKSSRWPCPRPYYGTMTPETLVPVPDFTQWQELADEIDDLTVRIEHLTQCVKMVGARPKDIEELDKVLKAEDNSLVPIENWALFKGEKGGLENMISWLPMERVMEVLVQLQQQRRERIDYCYQINGIGDILRGQGDPRSTATAEEIKEDYGSLRLRQLQQDLASFLERILQIKAEIICEKAPPQVLIDVSGIGEMQQEQQYIQAAVAMLKDQRVRDLRIDVDERSMVAMQDQKEKQSRMEYVQAMTPMIQQVVQAQQAAPQVLDVAGEVMLFASRGFRVGRDFEGTMEQFVDASRQIASKAREEAKTKPPQPPEAVQVEAARFQNETALNNQKHAQKMAQITSEENATRDREQMQAHSEAAIDAAKAENDRITAEREGAMEERLLRIEHSLEMAKTAYEAKLDREARREEQHNELVKLMKSKRVMRETSDGGFYSEIEDDAPSIQ